MTELSREAILAMVPGNELDVLIHQRIFKSEYPSLEEMKSIAEKQWEVQPHCTHFLMGFEAWKVDEVFKWEYNAPNYSKSISAAMKVESEAISISRTGYAAALISVLKVEDWSITTSAVIKIAQASAVDRCKAALLTTLEESK